MGEITLNDTIQQTDSAKPNRRLGNRKSKQGCLTCKARKVKCDETRPYCLRCRKSDRICLGYSDVFVSTHIGKASPTEVHDFDIQSRSRSQSQNPECPPIHFDVSPLSLLSNYSDSHEARSLQYYQTEIAGLLGGNVDHSFWKIQILELSETEPAIRQALIAVSSLWEARIRDDLPDRYACQQRSIEDYNKALALTSQRVAQPNADTVALATCVLFLCMHYLDAQREQAEILLRTGSGVLQTVLQRVWQFAESAPASTASTFLPIFERMILLLRLFGIDIPPFRNRETMLFTSYEFSSLDDARSIVYWLLSESHDLIALTKYYRYNHSEWIGEWDERDLPKFQERQKAQLDAYTAWKVGFDRLCDSNVSVSMQDDLYRSILLITYTIAIVWTSSCFDRIEGEADRFRNEYETVVREAGKLVAYNMVVAKNDVPFTFEMGLIPTLYLVCLKCRDTIIRHQALALLSRAPKREGLWKREETLAVVKRVIQLEESGTEVVAHGVVFQNARICDTQSVFADEKGMYVTFLSKRIGSEDLWMVWDEIVPIEK